MPPPRPGPTQLAAHEEGRQVRHRHHRPHPGPRRHRPLPPPGHARWTLDEGVQGLASAAGPGLARRDRGRGDGRVCRVQDRNDRGAAGRGLGDGPLPCRPPRRRCVERVPAPRPAGAARSPRPQGRPAVHRGRPCTPAPTCSPSASRSASTRSSPGDRHVQVELTWGIYQRLIAAYRDPVRTSGAAEARSVIDALTDGVPAPLVELRKLRRTLAKRAEDVLAYFERPRASNGPTEAVNGRRTSTRPGPRVPQPQQLHRPSPARGRRIQAPTTPWIVKSPITPPWIPSSPCSGRMSWTAAAGPPARTYASASSPGSSAPTTGRRQDDSVG